LSLQKSHAAALVDTWCSKTFLREKDEVDGGEEVRSWETL